MGWTGVLSMISSCVKKYLMTVLIFSAVLLGIIIGVIMHDAKVEPYTSRQIMYTGFLGEIFLNMLKGIALPLMVACLVAAVGSLEMIISKRIGGQLLLYIALTKIEAVSLGIILALAIRPGTGGSADSSEIDFLPTKNITTVDNFLDLIRNVFPPNVIDMTLRQYETVLIEPENGSYNMYKWEVQDGGIMRDSVNMLGVVNYAIILGAAFAVMMKHEAKPLMDVFQSLSHLSMIITIWILWIAPILIIFLIAGQVVNMKSAANLFGKLGLFILTVVCGHTLQCVVVYPIIYFSLIWKNPFTLMRDFMEALITAYATSSSMATMPISIKCLEENAKLDKRLVRFVIPVAHAISMDGAAIYQGAATVFVAQLNDHPLSIGKIVSIVFLGAAASVAAAGVPHSSIVVIVMVLNGVGLPIHDVGLLLAVDWLVDRSATVTNILGDCIIVGILAIYNKKLLDSTGPAEEINAQAIETNIENGTIVV